MLIRHLFFGLVGTALAGIGCALVGWSAWAILGAMVFGGNSALVLSAVVDSVPLPSREDNHGVVLHSTATSPASLPAAE